MTEILFQSGNCTLRADLMATPTADLLLRLLPFTGTLRFWGRLIRIDLPMEAYLEPGATELAEPGDIIWSPQHDDLMIPYGATPISGTGEIRLPEPGSRIGRLQDDPQTIRQLQDGAMIRIATLEAPRRARFGRGLADPRRGKGRRTG